ncbi:putative integrase/recombinase (plasmid) [Rhodococcus opacus B4]|uniref:Putative integrase/recombinase n=1 Tax=Rhodococcus opacus (strain B4) TaxID=632772 RepID=C1BE21_RHOOB|nr:hypothetical protein GFS60_06259 [Rhodococcus sp. WAY2]BAH47224.1 putative integrase/recombinase [Rhodococcus opacus B4]
MYERRESALILMGFTGAFWRSELVALNCGDVSVHRLDGIHIRLRQSKTDQEGAGSVKALPFTTSPQWHTVPTLPVGAGRGRLRHRQPSRGDPDAAPHRRSTTKSAAARCRG